MTLNPTTPIIIYLQKLSQPRHHRSTESDSTEELLRARLALAEKDREIKALQEDNKRLRERLEGSQFLPYKKSHSNTATNTDISSLHTEQHLDSKLNSFYKAFIKHAPREQLYDPQTMKKFCQEHAGGVFEDLLQQQLTVRQNETPTKKHLSKIERRVVSLLHVWAFNKNQVREYSEDSDSKRNRNSTSVLLLPPCRCATDCSWTPVCTCHSAAYLARDSE